MGFKISVTYNEVPDFGAVHYEDLSAEHALIGMGAFMRDMLSGESAITKVVIQKMDSARPEHPEPAGTD